MSEKEEKKDEQKPKPVAGEAKPAEAPAAKPAAAPAEAGEAKKPKLSRLSLKEVEEEIKKTQEKMGGMHSQYARFLLNRKRVLSQKN